MSAARVSSMAAYSTCHSHAWKEIGDRRVHARGRGPKLEFGLLDVCAALQQADRDPGGKTRREPVPFSAPAPASLPPLSPNRCPKNFDPPWMEMTLVTRKEHAGDRRPLPNLRQVRLVHSGAPIDRVVAE
jgi:hypothetical protein